MSAKIVFKDVTVSFNVKKQASSILGKKREPYKALDRISFEINEGDRVGILGNNGAGKSTLLRVISDILPTDSGEVLVTGDVHGALSLTNKLMAKSSCLENIKMRAFYYGFSGKNARDYVQQVRDLADLEDFIHQPIQTLSNGMKSRLMIAMFYAFNHDIIAFDEWVGVLDRTQLSGKAGLRRLVDSAKISVLASHNMGFIRRYCSRGIVLNRGKVEFDGDVNKAILVQKELSV